MSEQRVDDDLRERFQELRADTAGSGGVPEFGVVMARAQEVAAARPVLEVVDGSSWSRRRGLRIGGWASAALAATVAGVLLTNRGPSEDEEFARLVAAYSADVSAGVWLSPTSGLLEVPGIDLVRSLPSIGTSVRGLDPATRPEPATNPGPREDV
jgi:hypothetical protein